MEKVGVKIFYVYNPFQNLHSQLKRTQINESQFQQRGTKARIFNQWFVKLEKDKAIYLKTARNAHRFKEIYLFEKDVSIEDIKFADGEAIAAKWVSIEEFMKMFNSGEIVSNVDFDDKDYEKCLSLLK